MAKMTKAQLEAKLLEKEEVIAKLEKQITREAKVVEKAKTAAKETRAAKTKATKTGKELTLVKEELEQTKTQLGFATQNAETYAKEHKQAVTVVKAQQESIVGLNANRRAVEATLESTKEELDTVASEAHRMILELVNFKRMNPVLVLKQWFTSLKDRGNSTYMGMYITFLVLLGITLVSSAFGFGSLVKFASSEAAGAWTFNIINTIYIGLYIYMVGEFQDWWKKLKEKFSNNTAENNTKI
jgi:hypothetical protein